MVKVIPLSYNIIKVENKKHEVYTTIVNILINGYNESPNHIYYRSINKLLISNKDLYTDKYISDPFLMDNTIHGKVYKFILHLAHILCEYKKINILKQIYDGRKQRGIDLNILIKSNSFKLFKIYPWRSVIQIDSEAFDYEYINITEGLMKIFTNNIFKMYNILDVQSIKMTSDIPCLKKQLANLEYKYKNAFDN